MSRRPSRISTETRIELRIQEGDAPRLVEHLSSVSKRVRGAEVVRICERALADVEEGIDGSYLMDMLKNSPDQLACRLRETPIHLRTQILWQYAFLGCIAERGFGQPGMVVTGGQPSESSVGLPGAGIEPAPAPEKDPLEDLDFSAVGHVRL